MKAKIALTYLEPVQHEAYEVQVTRDIVDDTTEKNWGNENDVAETHSKESPCHSHFIILYLLLCFLKPTEKDLEQYELDLGRVVRLHNTIDCQPLYSYTSTNGININK